jgi:hypothetical protein
MFAACLQAAFCLWLSYKFMVQLGIFNADSIDTISDHWYRVGHAAPFFNVPKG